MNQKKEYLNIDFSKHYNNNKTIELSGFEEGSIWQGNYTFDSERVFEGDTSITLSSWYGKENSIENVATTSIPPGYTNGYISLYIKDKQYLANLMSLSLEISGENDAKKVYELAPLASVGWNRVALLIPSGWKKVTKNILTITSKKDAIAEVNIDRLWIENTSAYLSDVLSSQSKSLSLRTIGERTYLFSASSTSEIYTINNPPFIQNGSITVSLIPEHGKEMALSLNGTSMKMGGENNNKCMLSTDSGTSVTNLLKNTTGKDNLYAFLKADVQRGKVTYSFSNNGLDFEACGTVPFSKHSPINISLQGSYLIDSISAEY